MAPRANHRSPACNTRQTRTAGSSAKIEKINERTPITGMRKHTAKVATAIVRYEKNIARGYTELTHRRARYRSMVRVYLAT